MLNFMKKYILFALILASFSCQKENVEITASNDNVMEFELGIATKATATSFETGDKVALYAVEYPEEASTPELNITGNLINGEQLEYDGTTWKCERTLYWNESPCDFYAIYPYMELVSINEHHFEVALDQNQDFSSDILWAKAQNVKQTDGPVRLEFEHLMSRCVVKLTKGDKFEGEIPDDVVTHIYNTNTSGVLDFEKGSVRLDPQGLRKTITMRKLSNTQFEAIVLPQNIEQRTPLIEVTMGGIAYLLEYSLSFKAGYSHTINLILNTSPDQEKIEISIDPELGEMN